MSNYNFRDLIGFAPAAREDIKQKTRRGAMPQTGPGPCADWIIDQYGSKIDETALLGEVPDLSRGYSLSAHQRRLVDQYYADAMSKPNSSGVRRTAIRAILTELIRAAEHGRS